MNKINFDTIHNTHDLLQQLFKNQNCALAIHTLRSFGPVLLNRDDMGDAKRINLGGYTRTMISSQCIKAAIRRHLIEQMSNRTRRSPEIIAAYLKEKYDLTDAQVEQYLKLAYLILTSKGDSKTDYKFSLNVINTHYITGNTLNVSTEELESIGEELIKFFPLDHEVEFKEEKDAKKKVTGYSIAQNADKKAFKDLRDKLKSTIDATQINYDVALFGRMSTSGIVSSETSASSYSFAYSTNKNHNDSDYFTTQDIYLPATSLFKNLDENSGASYLNNRDIGADTFYDYCNFDLDVYFENIMHGIDYSDAEAAKARLKQGIDFLLEVVESTLVVTPTSMQHQMASAPIPIAYITLSTNAARVTYNDAFEEVIPDGRSIMKQSVEKLAESINDNPFETGETIVKYWISQKKYEPANLPGVVKCNMRAMLADIRGYLYGKIGIEA